MDENQFYMNQLLKVAASLSNITINVYTQPQV